MLYLVWSAIIVLFIFSLIGVVIPFIPDTILLWLGFLIYKYSFPLTDLSFSFWFGMAILSILILISDYLTNAYFVRKNGGSNIAMIGAALGLLLGTIFLGPFGIILGPFTTVFLIAILERKDSRAAFKIGIATILAFFSSSVAKIILQLLMILWFLIVVI